MQNKTIPKPRLDHSFNWFIIPFLTIWGVIGFLCGLGQLMQAMYFKNNAVSAAAVIEQAIPVRSAAGTIRHYDAVIYYQVDGKLYRAVFALYSSRTVSAGEFEVLINPKTPLDVRRPSEVNEVIGVSTLFILLAGVIVLPADWFFISRIRRNMRLVREGQPVDFAITKVSHNGRRSRRRRIYFIECQGRNPNTGYVCLFRSPAFKSNPTAYLEANQIQSMPVFFAGKGHHYYMDVSGIAR